MNIREQLTLRRKFIIYLIIIHLLSIGVAVSVLWSSETRLWVLVVEVVFIGSLWLGIRYVRALFVPMQITRTGKDLIDNQEFTIRFAETGQVEMDELIRIYNRMVDHLRAERTRLREQHYFLEQILQTSPMGILIFDFDDRIAVANPSAETILQMPADRLIGQTSNSLSGKFSNALHRLEIGGSQVIPLHGQRRVKCYKSRFPDQGFHRTFILLEELTEELRQSEKAAYEKLIRTTSHEVNNTVGAVNSLLQSCLSYQHQISDADRADYVNALQVATTRNNHLNEFIHAYADVVKLPPPTLRKCDVHVLLESIVSLMRVENQQKNIVWEWDVESPFPFVLMDRNQMEQVFVNILKNAMEAIGEHGRITIRLGCMNGRCYAMIEDTGHGIPPDIQTSLFTPFFSTRPNGQGIGLTLVQEILIQHRFEFSLESLPDQPTRFTIFFD